MEAIRQYIRKYTVLEDCGHTTPCWIWQRYRLRGYGQLCLLGRTYQAHRISYEAHVAEIPHGLEIDHLCCVSSCVNPAHLEPVTQAENLRRHAEHLRKIATSEPAPGRRLGGAGWQRFRKSCVNGHEYTPETTRLQKNGRRRCLTCERLCAEGKNRRKREKRAAARALREGTGQRIGCHRATTSPSDTRNTHSVLLSGPLNGTGRL